MTKITDMAKRVKMRVFIDVHAKNATLVACTGQSQDTAVFFLWSKEIAFENRENFSRGASTNP
jgi:hypothetical protein